MAKEIILKLNEEQAQIVSGACEFYARVRMGQFEEISHQLMVPQKFDDTWCSRRDGAEQAGEDAADSDKAGEDKE